MGDVVRYHKCFEAFDGQLADFHKYFCEDLMNRLREPWTNEWQDLTLTRQQVEQLLLLVERSGS